MVAPILSLLDSRLANPALALGFLLKSAFLGVEFLVVHSIAVLCARWRCCSFAPTRPRQDNGVKKSKGPERSGQGVAAVTHRSIIMIILLNFLGLASIWTCLTP